MTWPELSHLDEIVIKVEGRARNEDLVSVRESRAELIEAAAAVAPSSVPANAAKPKQVESLLTDLAALMDGFTPDLDDESLVHFVSGLHPIVENLIEASGMPHVHAHEEHSHEEHSHEEHSHEEESHDHP